MIRRPPRSTLSSSSAASDVYKRQVIRPNSAPLAESPALLLVAVHLKCTYDPPNAHTPPFEGAPAGRNRPGSALPALAERTPGFSDCDSARRGGGARLD